MWAFGSEARWALARRRQWLVAQGLAELTSDDKFLPRPRMLETLRTREFQQATQVLSKELSLTHSNTLQGEHITGTYIRSFTLASGKYAVIQKSKEFTLVPWQVEFEAVRSKMISGTATAQGINWDLSPKLGLQLGI